MKPILVWALGLIFCLQVDAAIRDTLIVQTFTFNDITKRRDVFSFPDDNRQWEKIYLVRTLKCDEKTTRDKYPCGEWDYSTHTHIHMPATNNTSEIFELENFVTPYGKRLDLNGDKGWTFVYDVSDYAPLLKGKVDISSGNDQELLDMKFIFIEGIPARNVLSVQNLYPFGSYNYGQLADDEKLKPFWLKLPTNAVAYKLRARISGHGHHGPRNCCEWDSKTHTYFANNEVLFRWNVWKNCGDNPIYPQGGTWQFDRAGWCPGTPVDTYDFELTPKVNPGDSLLFDYGIEMYTNNGEKGGNFLQSHQLFSYGAPNFKYNPELVDIIAPSTKDQHSRVNPICKDPEIVIRNAGRNTLRSLTIHYGLRSGKKETFVWNGQLGFLEEERVVLPSFSWKGLEKDSLFICELKFPNGIQDEWTHNDRLTSMVRKPMILPSKLFLYIEAQELGRAKENSYQIIDQNGKVLFERDSFEDNAVYEDFIELKDGCYELRISDKHEDGMIRQWWYRNSNPELVGKDGKIVIYDQHHNILKELKFDFAESEIFRFRVGKAW